MSDERLASTSKPPLASFKKKSKRLKKSEKMIADKLPYYIQRTILFEMKSAAEAANLPQGFIDNILLRRISKTKFEIKNAWKNSQNGAPLAVFFEHGTRDHYMTGRPMAWYQTEPTHNPKAIYSESSQPYPAMLFSYGHWATGIPATMAMHNGFRIGQQRLKVLLAREALSGQKVKVSRSRGV